MPKRTSKTGGELFIVDNPLSFRERVRVRAVCLRDWCDLSKGIDVATGFFEIGSLLALDGQQQKLDKIRILMGAEVSKRTRAAFANAETLWGKGSDDEAIAPIEQCYFPAS